MIEADIARALSLAPITTVMNVLRESETLQGATTGLDEIPRFLSPIETTVDRIVADSVQMIRTRSEEGGALAFSPRLYDSMLAEAAHLLNRCEAYRRESDAIASAAIRETFSLISRTASRALAAQALGENLSTAEDRRSAEYSAASSRFTDPGDSLKVQSDAAFFAASAASSRTRTALANEALVIEQAYDDALKSQLTLPGGLLDYVGRYQGIADLVRGDVAEAYERLLAVAAGMNGPAAGLMGLAPELPTKPVSGRPLLDQLIHWTRLASSIVGRASLKDQLLEVDVDIPIGRNYAAVVGGLSVSFDLNDAQLPRNFTAYRLIAVGLTYLKDVEGLTDLARLPERDRGSVPPGPDSTNRSMEVSLLLSSEETRTFAAYLTPPRQRLRVAQEAPAALYLGRVGPFNGAAPLMRVEGPLVANETPFGTWRFKFESPRTAFAASAAASGDSHVLIPSMVLHLSLLARPK